MEIKIQGRCVHDPRGSSVTSGSGAYIICGTQARLFNAGSDMATLHTCQIYPKNSALPFSISYTI